MPQDLSVQELQAQLFECAEELKIYKRNEKQMEYLVADNRRLQNEKLVCRETLQRALDKINFLEDEKVALRSHVYGAQLLEESTAHEIKKLNGIIDDLRKEIVTLKGNYDELMVSKKSIELSLQETKQSASYAEESAQAKRKALEDQITALKKVNNKLEQALLRLHEQTNNPNTIITTSSSITNSTENGGDPTINSLPQTHP